MKLSHSIPFGIAALALSCAANATLYENTLTFDGLACEGITPGVSVSVSVSVNCGTNALFRQEYGDVAGLVDITNTNVDYTNAYYAGTSTIMPLQFWGPDYSNLSNVAWAYPAVGHSHGRITLAAAAGHTINLLGFDMGAWHAPAAVGTNISVTNASSTYTFSGAVGTDGLATHFSAFGAAGMGQTVTIDWFNSAENVGLDELHFSVTQVPEPETYALLLAGLGLLGAATRKKRHTA